MAKKSFNISSRIRRELGEQIESRRIEMGLTRHALADMIGRKAHQIEEVESGDFDLFPTFVLCVAALKGEIKIDWKDQDNITE